MKNDRVLRERLVAISRIDEERWTSHDRGHDLLAASLAEYKSSANEWRATLIDVRSTFVSRTEHSVELKSLLERIEAVVAAAIAEHNALEAKIDTNQQALEARLNTMTEVQRDATAERAATYRLFGQARNLVLVIFTILGGIIGLLVYLRI